MVRMGLMNCPFLPPSSSTRRDWLRSRASILTTLTVLILITSSDISNHYEPIRMHQVHSKYRLPTILAIVKRNALVSRAGLLASIRGLQTDAFRAKSSRHAELLKALR